MAAAETEIVEIFPKLNVDDEPELGTTEIESMCVNCFENGTTRLLLTQIPFYKEVIIMSFCCESCGYQNNEIQPGGEMAPKGIRIQVKINTLKDLNRRVVKSDFSSVRIDELDFEIPAKSQKGEVTTIEGIIDRVVRGLDQDQPVRRIQHPEAAEQIDKFTDTLKELKEMKKPFTMTLEDISGNSFVENPLAPQTDPNMTTSHFTRDKEQNHLLGIFTQEEVSDKKPEQKPESEDSLLKMIPEGSWPLEELQGEVLQFQTNCPECRADCETNMKVTTIPHFKEVVIMATVCDNCGLRTNEVKPGGGIEEKGVKIEVSVRGRVDFSRDVLKSESCHLYIRELDCDVGAGALGGRFTTIEGLLTAMREQLVESIGMFMDSNDAETKERMDKFFGQLDDAIAGNKKLTVVLDDPTGNSYVQSLNDDGSPDEALRIFRYHRSHDQNEELGLNDMKTENYEEDAGNVEEEKADSHQQQQQKSSFRKQPRSKNALPASVNERKRDEGRKMAESKRSSTTTTSSSSTTNNSGGGSSSSSKSRKSKNDLIRSVVGSYLKQRNYMITDRFRRSDLILTQSTEQIVMNSAIRNEISKANSFLFSNVFCLNNNPAQVDQHFVKLCNYIKSQPEPIRRELSELINPLLCHLYIEMLKGRDWRQAIEFLRKHAPLLGRVEPSATPPGSSPLIMNQKINGTVEEQQQSGIPAATVQSVAIVYSPTATTSSTNGPQLDTFQQLVHKLSQITRIQDLENDDLTLQFRSCQYEIRLCSASVVALRRYLAKYGHSLILQILRSWFCFDTSDDKDFVDYSPDVAAPKAPQKRPRLSTSSNGLDVINGGISAMDEDTPTPPEPEFDFSEHSEVENTKFLLRNGFNGNFIRFKIREMNGGLDGSDDHRNHQSLSTVDMDDDDDEDDGTGYLPALEEIPSKTEPAFSEEQPHDDISGLFRRISSAERLRKLRECTNKLAQYQLPMCIYQVENVDDRLTAVAIDGNSCHLASGFEDSSIMLWSVNRSTQIGRKPYAALRDRRCHWNVTACDSSFSEGEDDEAEDAEEQEEDDEGGGRDLDDPGECSGLRNLFRLRSSAEVNRLNKLLPVYSRRLNKRDRWKQFMDRKCSDNVFTETGGVTLRGHSNAVTDLLFSAHTPLLLSVSRDLTMRAWQASDYNCRAVYRGHNHPIWSVAESPTGMYLATGSRDTTARLWCTDREFPLQIYVGHTQDVDTVAFHPNGNYLATGSTDLTVRLWCVTSGKLFRIFTDCRQPVNRISFSPDGKYLAAAGEENRVRIFDLAAGSQLTELRDHSSPVTCVSWSANSRHFVSAGADGTVRVWDALKMVSTSSSSGSSATAAASNSPNPAAANGTTNHSQKTTSSGSSSSSNNLLLAYSTGCRRIYRLHYNQLNGSLCCIGNS